MQQDGRQLNPAPPESFVRSVRDALEHLYDFGHLERHPLALAATHSKPSVQTPGQQLRHDLMAAIEALNPGPDAPFRSARARSYDALILHRVEGRTVQEAAHELNVSTRQVHRDLKRGEASVAALLWARQPATDDDSGRLLSSLQTEITRLPASPRATDVRDLAQYALEAVAALAQQHGVTLRLSAPPAPVVISADALMARQVMVNVLSEAVGHASAGAVTVEVSAQCAETQLAMRYQAAPGAASPVFGPVVAQLNELLGWSIAQTTPAGSRHEIIITMGGPGATILVIDDNPGFVDLLNAYLTQHACRVLSATNGQEGLRIAQEATPAAIVLDVMMPDMDGWELLQRLRVHPQTMHVPVIVCSVLANPDLARSLGATLVLPKPVSQGDVLSALQHLGVV